ncbi:alpha/beta hydrolase [Pseudoxanthomonas sp.]|uniref:alpha/beta hydrolase n=1 Tax=Pseudoxanthomonas sp. TaxID=1871049 RepID=UPI0026272963|nr:alpha/beta hydrolase [Pseudoxanthomonas sp.]WDS36953.1 MAG: alpha/beta hydrolase [Pseudoxanthomonas sp.]
MSVLERLDPEILPVVKMVPVIDMADIPAARAALHAMYASVGSPPLNPAISREDHLVPGWESDPEVQLRVFRPIDASETLPCLYWIQGGGYVLTAPDLDDQWCETIANDLRCSVVSVGWRRAPEHPFPAASNDCYAGFAWTMRNAEALAIDPGRVVIGGASSGGGAAAALALRIRDVGEFSVAHQLLVYPMLDDTNSSPSSHRITDPELWNRQSNELAWRAYLGSSYGSSDISPYAAPTRASDLARLPPATILTGELDLFVDENIAYAQRLLHAGVEMELHVYPAAHHGFDRHNPGAGLSRRFFGDRDAALRRAMWKQRAQA